MESLGLDEPGLDRLIRAGYELLELITFFHLRPKETRALDRAKGSKAPQAAGVIHTDSSADSSAPRPSTYDDFVKRGRWRSPGTRCRQRHATEGQGKYLVQERRCNAVWQVQRLGLRRERLMPPKWAFERFRAGDRDRSRWVKIVTARGDHRFRQPLRRPAHASRRRKQARREYPWWAWRVGLAQLLHADAHDVRPLPARFDFAGRPPASTTYAGRNRCLPGTRCRHLHRR